VTLLPGATLDPGAHWNGEAGWSTCAREIWHYTVGRDSRAIIRNGGLAALLIWDDVIWQYAPLEAVCFTECEWNRTSIGYEVESLDGSITDAQIAQLGYATLFTLTTFGIPQVFYDGPRLPVGYDYRGVTNHRNLVHNACDQHYDGFDVSVWDAIFAPPPPPPPEPPPMREVLDMEMIIYCNDGQDTGRYWYFPPLCDDPEWIDPGWVDVYKAAGIPADGVASYTTLVGMRDRRRTFRQRFFDEVVAT